MAKRRPSGLMHAGPEARLAARALQRRQHNQELNFPCLVKTQS